MTTAPRVSSDWRRRGRPLGARILVLLAAAAVILVWLARRGEAPSRPLEAPRILVLGFDGLDPDLLEEMMERGELPAFAALAGEGVFRRIETTAPAISPVAWSSFTTGMDPGGHHVYDFIDRDPATYEVRTMPVRYESSVLGGEFVSCQEGDPFWAELAERGIPSVMLRIPETFPPRGGGIVLAGMGVPDIRGTQGSFVMYIEEQPSGLVEDRIVEGGVIKSVSFENDVAHTEAIGPRAGFGTLTVPVTIRRDGPDRVTLLVGDEEARLEEGGWSDWIDFRFGTRLLGADLGTSAAGIGKFRLLSTNPLRLYLTPINFDPRDPVFPISLPDEYAAELAGEIGLFHTLGMPLETWALSEGLIDEDVWLETVREVLAEREAMLDYEISRWRSGPLVCVFTYTDRVQHIFWRFRDPLHPAYDEEGAARWGDAIPWAYREADRILAEARAAAGPGVPVIVLSDHGFTSFRKAVNLNRVLLEAGLLALEEGRDTGGLRLEGIDWGRTRAYAVGLGGIYINRAGREGRGIVFSDEAEEVVDEIERALLAISDPETGETIVRRVIRTSEAWHDGDLDDAPAVIVGYDHGYRTSWATALGGTPPRRMDPNRNPWSGCHSVDPDLVEGIFLTNFEVGERRVRMTDVGGLILGRLGFQAETDGMIGEPE